MFWRVSRPGLPDPAALFRRIHERWLTRAMQSGKPYPRIPIRRVDELGRGGFDDVRTRPEARARADRWWSLALDRVDSGRLDAFED